MEQKDTKPVIQYMFCRVYCLSCILIWNIVGIWAFRQQLRQGNSASSVLLILLLPFFFPALFMVFNLFALALAVSLIGIVGTGLGGKDADVKETAIDTSSILTE